MMNNRIRKALASTHAAVAGFLLTLPCLSAAAQQAPLTLVDNFTVPGLTGDFDFFAAGLKRNHFFAAAEEHGSLELFEASTGKQLQSMNP